MVFTAYSGIAQEVEKIGFPVDYTKVSVGYDEGPYPGTSTWAEPDVGDAVRQTRNALEKVKSGDWAQSKGDRRKWVDNFYESSYRTSIEMIRETLSTPQKSNSR
ncbi:MAG: hypothetical protein WDO06_05545 [Actinomycetota bacterium]